MKKKKISDRVKWVLTTSAVVLPISGVLILAIFLVAPYEPPSFWSSALFVVKMIKYALIGLGVLILAVSTFVNYRKVKKQGLELQNEQDPLASPLNDPKM